MAADEPKPSGKRHLPVLNARAPEPPREPDDVRDEAGAEEERPPWRRVALGAAATFLVWLPLSVLVETVASRLALPGPGQLAGHALAFCAGAVAGGTVAGRIGAERPGREGALAGAVAALLAWAIAIGQGAAGGALVWGLLLVILTSLGAGAGSLGGRLGARLRGRSAAR